MWDDDEYEIHAGPPEKGYKLVVATLAVVVIAAIAINLYYKWGNPA